MTPRIRGWIAAAAVAVGVVVLACFFADVDEGDARIDPSSVIAESARTSDDNVVRRDPNAAESPEPSADRGNVVDVSEQPSAASLPTRTSSVDVGRLSVLVVGPEKRPIPGIVVEFRRGKDWSRRQLSLRRTTSESGRAEFDGLVPGASTVAIPQLAAYRSVTIVAGAEASIEIGVASKNAVVARVLSAGRPLSGATIWYATEANLPDVAHLLATTDTEGRARIPAIKPGGLMMARASGHQPSAARLIEDVAGVQETTFDLDVGAARIFGTVIDGDGLAIGGALVRVSTPRKGASPTVELARSIETASDGTFALDDLSLGERCVEVAARGYSSQRQTVLLKSENPARVVFRMSRGGTIHGTVRTTDRHPAADVTVSYGTFGSFTYVAARTDSDGVYRLEEVGPGLLDIVADGGSRGRATENLAVGEIEEVRWDPIIVSTGEIRGTVSGTGFRPMADVLIVATTTIKRDPGDKSWGGSARTDQQGRFVIGNLTRTPHTLQVSVKDPSSGRDVEVLVDPPIGMILPGGPEVSIALIDEILPSTYITGRILGSAGQALRGVDVLIRRTSDKNPLPNHRIAGETGDFRFGPFSPGKYRIEAMDATNGRVRIGTFDVVSTRDLDIGEFRFPRIGSLRVVFAGERWGDERSVVIFEGSDVLASSSAKGDSVEFAALAPGEFTVAASDGKIGKSVVVKIVADQKTIVEVSSAN
jgi:hypothetical protein